MTAVIPGTNPWQFVTHKQGPILNFCFPDFHHFKNPVYPVNLIYTGLSGGKYLSQLNINSHHHKS